MQQTIVVTGVNGFVGKHLVSELVAAGHKVIGVGRENEVHEQIADKLVEYALVDLAQAWPALEHEPDAIIHLAGLAAVGPSFDAPQDYLNLNSAMVTNMCEHYVNAEKKPRIVLISSGAIYDSHQAMPISESGVVAFNSPYAVSKVLNENQAAYYNLRGLECVVMRPFNHIGPGQLPGFLVPDLIDKIRSRSGDEPILVGKLDTKRDYTDVRDVVAAYRLVATSSEKPNELIYNVCSGESISGRTILSSISDAMGISEPAVEIDQSLVRPNDAADIIGSSERLSQEFGWSKQYTIDHTIKDILA
jgi:GDP-4-dehydro-6-deoxy-D-mannose reductase